MGKMKFLFQFYQKIKKSAAEEAVEPQQSMAITGRESTKSLTAIVPQWHIFQ